MTVPPPRIMVVLLLALAVAGCQKKNLLPTVEQVPYLGLPATVNHVHGLDMSRVRATQSFADFLAQARRDNKDLNTILGGLADEVGIDPINDIDMMNLAIRGTPKLNQPISNAIMIARGRFGGVPGKLDKLRQWLGREFLIQPPAFQKSSHPASNIAIYKTSARSQYNEHIEFQIFIAVPADDLIIVAFSPELMNDTLDVIGMVKGVEGLHNSKAWIDKLKLVQTSATVWGIGDFAPPAEVKQQIANLPDGGIVTKIQNYLYDVDSKDGDLLAEVGLVCDSPASATTLSAALEKGRVAIRDQFAPMIGQQLPETAKLPNKVLITTEINVSRVILRLGQIDLDKISEEIEKNAQNLPIPGR
ncbi:hypothetical protein LLG95_00305 [bacterium]|nr:hypothetical protein [bacterium]